MDFYFGLDKPHDCHLNLDVDKSEVWQSKAKYSKASWHHKAVCTAQTTVRQGDECGSSTDDPVDNRGRDATILSLHFKPVSPISGWDHSARALLQHDITTTCEALWFEVRCGAVTAK